jgi:hypothetical protein
MSCSFGVPMVLAQDEEKSASQKERKDGYKYI